MTIFLSMVIFTAGMMLGSFFNVCIYRIPRAESIVFPPSHCTSCGTRLKWLDLFPLFSWLFLRGRCRSCKSKISIQYPLVELITGLLYMLLYLKFGFSDSFLTYLILASILIITTAIDIEHQIIPDELVFIGIIAGVVLVLTGLSVHWKDALIGLLVGGGTFLAVALLSEWILKKEGMGGGDIKLMGMIGLFLGWKLTVLSILLSIYAGGLIGGLLLILKIKKRGDAIPYGPFIAVGTIISIFFGNELITWYLQTFLY
ncbi:MAG TPA: prepilin peptidase [Clostridiales bacterium]|nr:prepilin peptidase [Clostridiales bacterium]